MQSTNYISTNNLRVGLSLDDLSPEINIKETKPKKKIEYQNITEIVHIFSEQLNYDYIGTQLVIKKFVNHKSFKYDYVNVDIFSDEKKYKWMYDAYSRRAPVTQYKYKNPKTKEYNQIPTFFKVGKKFEPKEKKNKQISLISDVHIQLNDVHYTRADDKLSYFRMRDCNYSPLLFPTHDVHWTQRINRACNYIDSVDYSQEIFDANSLYVYLDINKYAKRYYSYVMEINGLSDNKEAVRKFARELADLTMLLFYVNHSWGWSYNQHLDNDVIWNLALYVLCETKPFDSDTKYDWLKGVTYEYFRFLFLKQVKNICSRGIINHLLRMKQFLPKVTQRYYPKDYSKLSRKLFQQENMTSKEKELLERNNQIIDLYKQGKNTCFLSMKFGISKQHINRIIKQYLQ